MVYWRDNISAQFLHTSKISKQAIANQAWGVRDHTELNNWIDRESPRCFDQKQSTVQNGVVSNRISETFCRRSDQSSTLKPILSTYNTKWLEKPKEKGVGVLPPPSIGYGIKQIKLPNSLQTCARHSELQSNVSTIRNSKDFKPTSSNSKTVFVSNLVRGAQNPHYKIYLLSVPKFTANLYLSRCSTDFR